MPSVADQPTRIEIGQFHRPDQPLACLIRSSMPAPTKAANTSRSQVQAYPAWIRDDDWVMGTESDAGALHRGADLRLEARDGENGGPVLQGLGKARIALPLLVAVLVDVVLDQQLDRARSELGRDRGDLRRAGRARPQQVPQRQIELAGDASSSISKTAAEASCLKVRRAASSKYMLYGRRCGTRRQVFLCTVLGRLLPSSCFLGLSPCFGCLAPFIGALFKGCFGKLSLQDRGSWRARTEPEQLRCTAGLRHIMPQRQQQAHLYHTRALKMLRNQSALQTAA